MVHFRLRTDEEGADTAVWLAISQKALKQKNGQFFQDRTAVPAHLPLAWTKTSALENENMMKLFADFLNKFNDS